MAFAAAYTTPGRRFGGGRFSNAVFEVMAEMRM